MSEATEVIYKLYRTEDDGRYFVKWHTTREKALEEAMALQDVEFVKVYKCTVICNPERLTTMLTRGGWFGEESEIMHLGKDKEYE